MSTQLQTAKCCQITNRRPSCKTHRESHGRHAVRPIKKKPIGFKATAKDYSQLPQRLPTSTRKHVLVLSYCTPFSYNLAGDGPGAHARTQGNLFASKSGR